MQHGLAAPPKKQAKPENLLTLTCAQCGKEFERHAYNAHPERNSLQFCGRECQGKYKRAHLSGANSPAWRGGYSRWYVGNWKPQRKAARERDHHTCQDCGVTSQQHGYALDVHHIQPYESFDNPADANDLSNLVTLCRVCHTRRHTYTLEELA
jgi:hypothetical protein